MPTVSDYNHRLIEAIVRRRNELWLGTRRPVAIRLMPEEVRTLIRYMDEDLSLPRVEILPIEPGMRVLGMAVIESVSPPASLEDRFLFEDR